MAFIASTIPAPAPIPLPVVRIHSSKERLSFRKELYDIGFCKSCCSFESLNNQWSPLLFEFVSIQNICQTEFQFLEDCYGKHILLNSPRHMLEYIRKYNLYPMRYPTRDSIKFDKIKTEAIQNIFDSNNGRSL